MSSMMDIRENFQLELFIFFRTGTINFNPEDYYINSFSNYDNDSFSNYTIDSFSDDDINSFSEYDEIDQDERFEPQKYFSCK